MHESTKLGHDQKPVDFVFVVYEFDLLQPFNCLKRVSAAIISFPSYFEKPS